MGEEEKRWGQGSDCVWKFFTICPALDCLSRLRIGVAAGRKIKEIDYSQFCLWVDLFKTQEM